MVQGNSKQQSAEILNMAEARARRQDFATHTGFDTAGGYLKEIREKNGLSLSDISERTHIREDHLRGIETGDLSLLPPRAYVSGFVKTYAEFLGLAPAPIVLRFREDVGLEAAVTIDPKGFETAEAKADIEKRDMSLWAVLAVIIFILWCSWQVMQASHRSDSAPPQTSNGPTSNAPTSNSLTSAAPIVPEGFPRPADSLTTPAIVDPLTDAALVKTIDGVTPARITDRIEPVYPRLCEGQSGPLETVETTFNITADGRVAGARVLSSTNDCFNRSAINALKRWRFIPRQVDGVARASYDQVHRFTFKRPA